MSEAQLTSVGTTAYFDGKEVELRIHEENNSFKVIPRPKFMTPWRELVSYFDETNVSQTQISLGATDIFAAETELRKLLFKKDELRFSPSTLFRYTSGKTRFILRASQLQPAALTIESSTERLDNSNPRAIDYLVNLKGSAYCRSAEMQYGEITIILAPAHASDKHRLATYEALVNLY